MDPFSNSPAFGIWMASTDNVIAEMLGGSGYDCVVLDTQHGGVTWDKLGPLLQAVELGGAQTLVRVGGCDHVQIGRALDLGANGVIVPMVSTAEQACQAAQGSHYPPDGSRSFGRVRGYYSAEGATSKPRCFVMIETAEGIANLDAIAATPGIDGLFVGPVDLALGLGLGPVLESNDQVFSAIGDIAAACRRHDKICASASLGIGYSRTLLTLGVNLIVQGNDYGYIRRGAAADIKELRSLSGPAD